MFMTGKLPWRSNLAHTVREIRIHDPYPFICVPFMFWSWLLHEPPPASKHKGCDLMSVTMQTGQVWRRSLKGIWKGMVNEI